MGIESIHIENFRTCRSVELSNLGHLTVLVGRNGVGKSNILRGIEWVALMASSRSFAAHKFYIFSYMPGSGIKADLTFQVGDINYRYLLMVYHAPPFDYPPDFNREEYLSIKEANGVERRLMTRKNEDLYLENNDPFAKIDKITPGIYAMASLKPSSETKENIAPPLDFFRRTKYYPLEEPVCCIDGDSPTFISRSTYLEWLGAINDLPDFDDSIIMLLLHMYLERRSDFDELNSILGQSGLGIIAGIEINTVDLAPMPADIRRNFSPNSSMDESEIYHVRFWPGQGWEGSAKLPRLMYGSLSYGTRRIIRLLVSIFYDKNSVYLFEQPEDGIHPELLKNLIEVLRAYPDKGQIIMASHSSALLDVLHPEEVRLVTMTGGETHVRALSEVEMEGAKRYMEQEGSLSEYLSLLPEA